MAVTFEVNGFKLDTANVCKVLEGTEYSSAVAVRRVNLESPGLHGQVPMWMDPLDTLKIQLRLRALKPRGAAQTVLHNNVRTIQGLFRAGGYIQSQSSIITPLEVIRDRDGLRMRALAQLESISPVDYSHTGGFADMTVVLNAPRGVWESTTTEDAVFVGNVNGQSYSTGVKTVLPFYPLIRVAGPLTSVTIRDVFSNTGVMWTRSPGITSGRFLLIDPYLMGAWDKATNGFDPNDPGTNDARAYLHEIGNGPFNATSFRTSTTPVTLSSIDVVLLGGTGGTPVTLRGRYTEP